uniref:Uncharacterized protein n=1 Tax=Anguilla anguilla TaxID=7936 RepID=A0A0E9QJI7_ANGAN
MPCTTYTNKWRRKHGSYRFYKRLSRRITKDIPPLQHSSYHLK